MDDLDTACIGRRVRITTGRPEFVGKTGTMVAVCPAFALRVFFDVPVAVPEITHRIRSEYYRRCDVKVLRSRR